MTKRTLAALCALLTFAAVLAVVPLTSPAAAHPQTTTKQYCAYDPFAGQQCWTQTVPVAHHHAPANQPCPAGTTGTPPNCLPIPPTNDPAPSTDPDEPDGGGEPKSDEPKDSGDEPDGTDGSDGSGDGSSDGSTGEPEGSNGGDEPDGSSGDGSSGDGSTGEPEGSDGSGSDGTGSGSSGDGSDQTPNPCEPWPACQSASDPKSTTPSSSRDPCSDYADDLIAALNQPSSDGSYSLPDHPDGCSGASTREMLGRVRVFGADAARLFKQAFEKAMEYQGEAAENEGKLFNGTDELLKELAKLWDETPNPAKAAALGVACFFLIPTEEVSSLTPAGTAVAAAQVATCSAALALASEIISNAANDSDDGNGQDDGQQPTDPQPDGDGSGDAPATTEPTRVTAEDRRRAFLQMRRGEITYEQYREIRDRYRCQTGQACNQ